MSQTQDLITTLKKALRSEKITYAEIAAFLHMSEANVKRMFATCNMTMTRIEEICGMLNMELTDLFRLHEQNEQQVTRFSEEQENELVKDLKFFLVAVGVRNKLSFNNLLSVYDITETECIHYLAKLDRLKIIDLLPGNKIKLRITDEFRWIPNGPIEKFFEKKIQADFLNSKFSADMEQRLFQFGMFSESSIEMINNKISQLEKDISDLHKRDARLPLDKRRSVGCLMAIRPWESQVFVPYYRERNRTS
jgi:DNA-binding Xre family transcriptional regulator